MIDIKSKKRNSLIELYRFLFAMNVVIGHGFFPIDIPYFGPDRISVEFFFILSGYLFCSSLEKYKDMPVGRAVFRMTASKIKPLAIPMVIGLISNAILNYITSYNPLQIFRYLWYIPAMLAAFLLFTVLRILVKNDRTFWIISFVIFVVSTALRYSGPDSLFLFDYVRSPSAVSLGILLAKLPKLKLKRKWLSSLPLIPVAIATFIIIFLRLAEDSKVYEAIVDLVLYPILVYLTFQIDFAFPLFDYLGSLSFGIYAYQCPARLVGALGVGSRWIPFFVIIALTLVDDLIKRAINNKKTHNLVERTR